MHGEFNNTLDDLLAQQLGIQRRLTTPYHPQVEYFNSPDLHVATPNCTDVCTDLYSNATIMSVSTCTCDCTAVCAVNACTNWNQVVQIWHFDAY